jgi:hypothetical protein
VADGRPPGTVSRLLAREQGRQILDGVRRDEPALLAALHANPYSALHGRSDLSVRLVPESSTDAGCSVAGAYVADAVPPALAVVQSASSGRRAFTLLHEFAHHEQQTKTGLMTALLAEPDGGHALEDAACDAFAAAVLLPDELTSSAFTDGVTADAITELWKKASASRAAVCVRAAEMLPSPGHVVLLDGDGDVQFAAAHRLPPVRRGTSQAHVPVVRQALAGASHRAQGRTQLAYRDGIRGAELYAQSADMGGYIVLIAVLDRAAWERFAPTPVDQGPTGRFWTCEQCGHEFRTFSASCRRCGAPTCPECGRCNCPLKVTEQRCESCFLVLPGSMYSTSATRCDNCI